MAYTAFPENKLHYYGELPDTSGNSNRYELSKSNVPDTAKEILVYLWATTKGDEAFHRYYYRIQTTDGIQLYNQYMNVAASKDVSLNSANLWLPVFKGHGEVVVTLEDAEDSTKKGKCIIPKCEEEIKYSSIFILGFR
ncbi:Hypothetical predicted protein [Paramuricea clavata]|uniref:Uncharacterized protein n=1 Tax=Paramuricea clavata TaxID=317549 RepID=A0A6S7J7R8_PARCT|nr:Hypothetical predicted protein [Paramuricea clavata]